LLGDLLASQFESKTENPETIGPFFRTVFEAASKYRWGEMIRRTTGEALNPIHFARAISE
jgi:hypothetical protein